MLCKLLKNISFNADNECDDSCAGVDISVGVGGISNVYLYNIDDIENLKYENDNRYDDSYVVDTIITSEPFYRVDFTDATYQEQFQNGKWTHQLDLTINNISTLFEGILAGSTNGRYLVCFKPNGSDDYRMFGWRFGASLTYNMNLNSDSLGYTVTLSDESEFPLMAVYSDNFNLADKVYTPIFSPKYGVKICEQESGHNNGYVLTTYVTKTNTAGQPLDSDNKLCEYSGKKQDAYKLVGQSDGGYHIIGTYASDATFEGQNVRVYDAEACPPQASGSIKINNSSAATINLNSTTRTANVSVDSTAPWQMTSSPQFVTVAPQQGLAGVTSVLAFHSGIGGVDHVQFQNTRTKERVNLTVNVNLVDINPSFSFPNGTTQFILSPKVMGQSTDYTYTVSPTIPCTKAQNGDLICSPSASNDEQVFTFTFTHANDSNEVKTTRVVILGNNVNPQWEILTQFCEIV
jgi:hypothetical protein